MYKLITTNQFEKDVLLCAKRHFHMEHLKQVILLLKETGKLPTKYKLHKLKGGYSPHYECHIKPDWLLIWLQDDVLKEIKLVRTGTHSDLF